MLEQPDGKDAQGKVWGKGEKLPCLLRRHHSPLISTWSPTLKLLEPFGSFWVFMETLSHRHDG